MPITAKLGISRGSDASAPSSATEAMPAAISSIASADRAVRADRGATFSDTIAPAAISSAIGTNAAPASVGEKPSTFCR